MKKLIYVGCGWLSLALGVIGVFLPLLPTTPFVLLAAFCFSRGSNRLHQWLLAHRLFGKLIADWENHGVISLKAKILATSSMLLLVSYPLIWGTFANYLKLIVVLCISCVLVFIWSRPSIPQVVNSDEL